MEAEPTTSKVKASPPVSCRGDADGQALPLRGLADGDEVVGLRPCSYLALDYSFAGSELSDDGVEAAFDGGGYAAVGCVVAVPDDVGDGGIEVGQVQCGDVTSDAVDKQPGTRLPESSGGRGRWEAHRSGAGLGGW